MFANRRLRRSGRPRTGRPVTETSTPWPSVLAASASTPTISRAPSRSGARSPDTRSVPQGDTYASLVDPAKSGADLGIHVVPEPRVGKNRLHLDLYTEDLNAEAARVESLGAVRVAHHGEGDGGWIVYEDTDGNQFCVCAA
ncbi:VOC family protein [Yinghuangia aomiensis]